jgi:hypothetical protein
MTFEEWLEAYYSGTQIDDDTTGMMRTAFEAGKCEACTVSLRDKFAMAAMQGLFASWGAHDVTDFHEIAADSYNLADAMLKERVK